MNDIPKEPNRTKSIQTQGKLSINRAILLNFLPIFVSVGILICVMVSNITTINKTKDEVSKYNTEVDILYTASMEHYNMAMDLMRHINDGDPFTQTTNPKNCVFGTFLYGDTSEYSTIMNNFLSKVESYHSLIHTQITDIVNLDFRNTLSPEQLEAFNELSASGGFDQSMNYDMKIYESSLKLELYHNTVESNFNNFITYIYEAIDSVDKAIRQAESDLDYVIIQAYVICGIASVIVILAILNTLAYIRKQIVAPITFLREGSRALAEGDLSANFMYDSKTEELSMLSVELQDSVGNLQNIVLDIEKNVASLSQKDFSIQPNMEYIGDFKTIEKSINTLIDVIRNTMSEISSASGQVHIGANQVSSSAQALAHGTMQQTTSVGALCSVVEDVTEKVMQTASNATEADKLGKVAVKVVSQSTIEMQHLMEAMKEIQESSAHIEKIIQTIDDIAFQTNILALNAAVEAARAGQAGRGFAVVADEVRNLAQKSAEAAKNTTDLINTSLQAIEKGTVLAHSTNGTFEEVARNTKQVLEFVAEIAQDTQTQLESIDTISTSVGEISAVVQTNSATSEESAASSEELSSQSAMMNHLISQFKLQK